MTGQPPLEGKSMIETILKIRQEQPLPPRRHQPSTPAALEAIVMRMLEKNPAARFQTATEVRAALEHFARTSAVDA